MANRGRRWRVEITDAELEALARAVDALEDAPVAAGTIAEETQESNVKALRRFMGRADRTRR